MRLHSAEELDDAQVGYATSAGGDKVSSWPPAWTVIGDVSSDPIIADRGSVGVPILYAVHGTGTWKAEPLAPSLAAFSDALSKWLAGVGTRGPLEEDELRADVLKLVNSELTAIVGAAALPLWLGHHWLD